jgi:acyl-coenzyme A synthetase/AMP-(fatty) acid ligase
MTNPFPLSRWWQQTDNTLLAVGGEQDTDWHSFRQRVADWVHVLEQEQAKLWAVYHPDASEFLAMLLALWQLSKTAVVAGDKLPGTEAMLASKVEGFIGEFDAGVIQPSEQAAEPDWQVIDKDYTALQIFTSGSSGEPKRVAKTLAELELELTALDHLHKQSDVVLTTVTHHHLYGIVFRLLRPFCYQQAFSKYLQDYPEDLISMAKKYGRFTLVSSPAHLSRMNTEQDWHEVKADCQQVFSSAAPLQRHDSMTVSSCLEAEVTEIYGSTETGAIAWRCQQQSEQDALWRALSHIQLSVSSAQTLQVSMMGHSKAVDLADRVQFSDAGLFSLLGRVDQIVKVEGKRLSLTQLEQQLVTLNYFDQVRALVLTRKRTETAIVAVLSTQGLERLHALGRKAFIQQLKQNLAGHFEPVLLPRRWRFVAQLPVNTQGKTTMKLLEDQFEDITTNWPKVLNKQEQAGEICLSCELGSDLMFFEGHFEEQAILPGITQVHWAAKYGQDYFAIKGHFIRLEAVKFQQLLTPGQPFLLQLRFDKDKAKLHFTFKSEQGIHSSGRLCYAA